MFGTEGGNHASRTGAEKSIGFGGIAVYGPGFIPSLMYFWRAGNEPPGATMMVSLYVTLGFFLLLAVRNPSAHRSLIAYAGWANIAHPTVMALMAIHPASDRSGVLVGTAIFLPIGVTLIALAPAKQPKELVSAAISGSLFPIC